MAKESLKQSRVNIRMSKKIHSFYKNMSEEMGISVSAVMVIALNEYMKQQVTVEFMPDLMELYRRDQAQERQSDSGQED